MRNKLLDKLKSVREGDVVTILFHGRSDGEESLGIISTAPVTFTAGNGELIEAVDEGVIGMKPGESRTIKVTPENGFGERLAELIQCVSKELLLGKSVSLGEVVRIETDDGQNSIAEIKEIGKETVTIDFNHPLAGKDLILEVEVIDIEKPNPSLN